MDAAQAADQSDPAYNQHLSRRCTGPPSSKRSPVLVATSDRTIFIGSYSTGTNNRTTNVAQRALHAATQPAADLDRRAAQLGLIGLTAAAERIEAIAETMREVLR